MKNLFKKLFIPSGEKTELVAYKSWIVRWKSVKYDFSTYANLKDESEIFPSEEDAHKFAQSIKDAFNLTKSCMGSKVHVEENQNKLATLHQ